MIRNSLGVHLGFIITKYCVKLGDDSKRKVYKMWSICGFVAHERTIQNDFNKSHNPKVAGQFLSAIAMTKIPNRREYFIRALNSCSFCFYPRLYP
jgi:hypothetical protein